MPTRKPFPSKETELNTYFRLVVAHIITHYIRLHVSESNKIAVNEALEEWNMIFPLSQNSNIRTKSIVANKNRVRDTLMSILRKIYADIPQSTLTLQDRNTFKLNERKSTRTTPAPPTTHPIGYINTINRLQHTISFTDEDGSLAKPKGVRGCQIWCKVGEPVTDLKELTFLALSSASPYVHKFAFSDGGKSVQYWLRWENTRGKTGPWGAAVNATVNG